MPDFYWSERSLSLQGIYNHPGKTFYGFFWELVFGLIERMFEKKSSLEVEKLEYQYFG